MKRFVKQPADVLDYDIDLKAWFKTLDSDYVLSATVAVTEGDGLLEAGPTPHPPYTIVGEDKDLLKVWLGGGTNVQEYKVTVVATTAEDRVKEIDFKVRVKEI